MNRRAQACILGFALILWHGVCAAQETGLTVYTVGVEKISYNPYYTVEDGEYTGFVKDALNAFAKTANIKFTFVPLPIKRLHRMYLAQRDIDFIYPDNPDWALDLKKIRKSITAPLW